MATKRVITETSVIPDQSQVPITETLSEEEINLAAIRERYAPAGATYKIYKVVKGANPAWCFDSIDEIDESSIQQQYGGGRYAIRIFMSGKLKDTVYIDIAEPSMNMSINGKPGMNGDPMHLMLAMMQKQVQDQQAMLLAMIGRPTPMAAPTGTSIQDTIALFKLFKDEQPLTSNGIVSKIVEKALDRLGEPSDGVGDWKMELIKGVKDVAPTAIQALAMASGMKPPMPPGMGAVPGNPAIVPGMLEGNLTPAPITNDGQPVAITPENIGMMEELALKQAINMVKPKILGGVLPADLAIEWLLANAGDPMYQPFLKAALTKSIDDIIKLDAEIANPPFKDWFVEVLTGIKEEFKKEATEGK